MKTLKLLLKIKINLIVITLALASTIAVPAIYNKLFRAFIGQCVYIVKDKDELKGSGTGFIVEDDKGRRFFVTNNHVCNGLSSDGKLLIESDYQNNDQTIVKVLKTDEENDLCVATAPKVGRALKISTDKQSGDNVSIFGHPMGYSLHRTPGEIIGKTSFKMLVNDLALVKTFNVWQTSAATSPGSSGSPVVDNLGRVVGVVFALSSKNSYTSFFVDSAKLKTLLETI